MTDPRKQISTTHKLLLICFVLNAFTLSAQISEGGVPPSFQQTVTLRSAEAIESIPVTFSIKDLKGVDRWRESEGHPPTVATLIDVDYNTSNAGRWQQLPSGEQIWQLQLYAKDALALMLYYNAFYLPEGGKLFIYNEEKSHLLGAYTHQTNPSGGRFATEFVTGDKLTLEYVAGPDGAAPRLEIEAVGYGYNHLVATKNRIRFTGSDINKSGSCEVDVNCEEGDLWKNEKKGVCKLVRRIGNRTVLCTGSLVNNTAQDLKPYLLSAYHCALDGNVEATPAEMNQWLFYFHLERAGCKTQDLLSSKTMTGCKKVAFTKTSGESDGLLLLINTPIPSSYGVYYNGWDLRENSSPSGVCIHHPEGDYKKISTYLKPPTTHTFKTKDNLTGGPHAHWNVTFEATKNGHGITENGSSGAPLFNNEKRIIGTLSGGSSTCRAPRSLNLYGKMSYHWNKYPTSVATRMDHWLDPLHTGKRSLDGRYFSSHNPAPQDLQATYQDDKTVRLTWKSPSGEKQPSRYRIYANGQRIGESQNTTFVDESPQVGEQQYMISALYNNDQESAFLTVSVLIDEYKAPTELTLIKNTNNQIALRWSPPLYEKTIYWGGKNAQEQITMKGSTPFYFGQRWTREDIKLYHKKCVTAVKFVPIKNNSYEVAIFQGKRSYREKITKTVNGKTNTFELNAPFPINGKEELIVSIYAAKPSLDKRYYPAICDNGPAIKNRGNIYSYDGKNWRELGSESLTPNEFDLNFFVAAIVSSKELPIPTGSDKSMQHAAAEILEQQTDEDPLAAEPSADVINLRSLSPTPFPQVSGYAVYRNNVKIKRVPATPTRFIDNESSDANFYQVAAIYSNKEGKRSEVVSVSSLNNEVFDSREIYIHPTIFDKQIIINGFEFVSSLEIHSAEGKLFMHLTNPDQLINTADLPNGYYVFTIYSNNNTRKTVIKALKKR